MHSGKKKKEGIQTGKEKVNLSLFSVDIIVYVVNLTASTKMLIELISKYVKAVGYTINIQDRLYFYTLVINN